MYYIKVENGAAVGNPITEKNFRKINTDVSFPRTLSQDLLAEYGYEPYMHSEKPRAPSRYQTIEEAPPEKNSDNVWVQQWMPVDTEPTESDAEYLERKKKEWHSTRKQIRRGCINRGFEFNGEVVASDAESRSLIQGSVLLAQASVAQGVENNFSQILGAGWRAKNGNIVATDAHGMIEMAVALAEHVAQCDAVSEQIKSQIDAATSEDQLDQIDWSPL